MDKTSNDPVRGNGHARAVQRLPARRVRDFSWPCSRVNLRGGAQKAAVARNRATFTWPCAATPCTRQVVQRALAGAPWPGRETTFMGRRHYHQRCIGRVKAARGVLWSARHACERGVGKRRCWRFGRLGFQKFSAFIILIKIGAGGARSGSFPHFCPFASPSCSDKNTQQQLCVPTKWYHSGQYMLWGPQRYHKNV